MRLEVHDTYTKVSGISQSRRAWLRLLLAARPNGYKYMPKYKSGEWDGFISLYRYGKFPTGLLDTVVEGLEQDEEPYVIEDKRCYPPAQPFEVSNFELRDYQLAAVITALDERRGVLKMATNAGKTLVMACVIQATGCKAVVIVPTRALLTQTADRLAEMLDMEIGRYGAGSESMLDVTVTTIASLPKLAKQDLSNNVCVMCDEVHHLKAATVFDNIFDLPGPYRFGLSGTPLHYDDLNDLKLLGASGPVIVDVSNTELISNGWSVKPVVKFHVLEGEHDDDLKYYEAYSQLIVDNQQRSNLVAKLALLEQERGPVLIVVDWIRHARHLSSLIDGSVMLTGNNSKDETTAALDDMRAGTLRILVATNIFGEGVDIPSVSTLILADAAKGYIRTLQRVGRGLRTHEGKSVLHIHDFIDDTNKYLLAHSNARHRIYTGEGFECELVAEEGERENSLQAGAVLG